jgi:indole-3-glycerol phosphate synthase
MAEFLATIVEHVRKEVERRRREIPAAALRERPLFHTRTRGFAESLTGSGRRIIAEIKRASPSRGMIRENFAPVAIARDYASHGASAISVLTEERFFQGRLLYLEQIKSAVSVPLLRKDFIVDSYQLTEARSYGADAVLFIAALLDPSRLRELCAEANALSLDTLVEVHSEQELNGALAAGAQILGINNRDLTTFQVDLATTAQLAPLIPPDRPVVCESGIESLEQIQAVEEMGIHVFLIGESLMRAPEPGVKLAELLGEKR